MGKKIENIHDCLKSKILLDQLADKWTMLALGTLNSGPVRFNQLKKTLNGVSQKSLTQCLRKLERSGLIERTVLDGKVLGVEYSITDLGESLSEPFDAVFTWIAKNAHKIEKAEARFDEGRAKKARS
jgi:DNA-binding HxlR family transcriptional regulator